MKDLLYISQDREIALIQELVYRIKRAQPDIHPSKTCFLCVSPDYSSIVTQHLSHSLTMDGEIFHIEAVNVPFPDESEKKYKVDFSLNYAEWVLDWKTSSLLRQESFVEALIGGLHISWRNSNQIITILRHSAKIFIVNSSQILSDSIMMTVKKIFISGGSNQTIIGNDDKYLSKR